MTFIMSGDMITSSGISTFHINHEFKFGWNLHLLYKTELFIFIMEEHLQDSVAIALRISILKTRVIEIESFSLLCVYQPSQHFIQLTQYRRHDSFQNLFCALHIWMANSPYILKQKESTNTSEFNLLFPNIGSKIEIEKRKCSTPKRANALDDLREEYIPTYRGTFAKAKDDQIPLNKKREAMKRERSFGSLRTARAVQDLHMIDEERAVDYSFNNYGCELEIKFKEKNAHILRKIQQDVPETPRPSRRLNIIAVDENEIDEEEEWMLKDNTSNTTSTMQRNYLRNEDMERSSCYLPNKYEKELFAVFRVKNKRILSGRRVTNSSSCSCEVATPLRNLKLRLNTIIEDGDEDTIKEEESKLLRSVAKDDLSMAGTQVHWWKRAARSVRRRFLTQRRDAPASVQATAVAAAAAVRSSWWRRVLQGCFGWRETDD